MGYDGYCYIANSREDLIELKHRLAQMRKPVLEKRVAEFKDVCQSWKLRDEEIAQLLGFPGQYPSYAEPLLKGYSDFIHRDTKERMDNVIKINAKISEIFRHPATKTAFLNSEQLELDGKSVLHMLKGRYVNTIQAANFVSSLQESTYQ